MEDDNSSSSLYNHLCLFVLWKNLVGDSLISIQIYSDELLVKWWFAFNLIHKRQHKRAVRGNFLIKLRTSQYIKSQRRNGSVQKILWFMVCTKYDDDDDDASVTLFAITKLYFHSTRNFGWALPSNLFGIINFYGAAWKDFPREMRMRRRNIK